MRILALASAFAFAGLAGAATTIADVTVPDTATVAGQKLVLNGAGLRKKAIFKVYVGALYLPSKTSTADAALAAGTAKVTMRFMRDVDAEKLRDAWTEGFANNNAPADVTKLKARIDRFNALFTDVKEGDLVEVDLTNGATVTIGGKARGSVEGDDFAKAVLRIWLGPKPPSDDLKAGMLGKS